MPRGVSLPKDAMRWEAHHVYSKRLWSRRQRRWVDADAELACLLVIDAERSLPGTSASADRNILPPLQVSLKERKGEVPQLARRVS
jgi:hypothetical protein